MSRRSPTRSIFLVLAVFSFLTLPLTALAGTKVQVCHVPPDDPGNFHTITISENALDAHLDHGDLAGSCNAYCSRLCDDGNACTVDDSVDCETVGCPSNRPPVDCDDSNACSSDSCEPASGCVYSAETCPATPCMVGSCDPADGECDYVPVYCGAGETCNPTSGVCEGDRLCPCADSLPEGWSPDESSGGGGAGECEDGSSSSSSNLGGTDSSSGISLGTGESVNQDCSGQTIRSCSVIGTPYDVIYQQSGLTEAQYNDCNQLVNGN